MIFLLCPVFQIQFHHRIFARQAGIETQVRHRHDVVIIDHRLIDLVAADGDTVTDLVKTVAVLLPRLTTALMPQLFLYDFRHFGAWRTAIETGVQQVKNRLGHLTAVHVDKLWHVLNANNKTTAKFAPFSQCLGKLGDFLQAGLFIDDKPHTAVGIFPHALQINRGHRQPHRHQRANRLAVTGRGGNKQPATVVLRVGHPLPDAELGFPLLVKPLQVTQGFGIVGHHRADRDGRFLNFFLYQVGRGRVFEKFAQGFQVDRQKCCEKLLDTAIAM